MQVDQYEQEMERLTELQRFTDELSARVLRIVPSDNPVEIRLAVDINLWLDGLRWLDDDTGESDVPSLQEAVVSAVGEKGYVESEEEGEDYAFYCYGLDIEPLQTLVSLMVGKAYQVEIEPLEGPLARFTEQVRVLKV